VLAELVAAVTSLSVGIGPTVSRSRWARSCPPRSRSACSEWSTARSRTVPPAFLSEMPHGGFSTYALDDYTRINHAMVRFG